MKKFLFYIGFLLISLGSFAQPGPDGLNPKKEEKIQALYIAYVTKELNITSDEATRFWPVHSQYDAEIRSANQNITNEIDRQQAILNVKKKYQGNFQKILGNDRANQFYRLDVEFREKLMQRLKQMRQNRKNGAGPGGGGGMRREKLFR